MFNKYFDLVKSLFDAVFVKGGSAVHFTDYLKVLGFTLAIIVCVVLILAVLFFVGKGPVAVYKKLTKKINGEIKATEKVIETKEYGEYTAETIFNRYDELLKNLKKRKLAFSAGVVFLYIPFVIPTLLFIFSLIKSCF